MLTKIHTQNDDHPFDDRQAPGPALSLRALGRLGQGQEPGRARRD